jgi:hypothetical protein
MLGTVILNLAQSAGNLKTYVKVSSETTRLNILCYFVVVVNIFVKGEHVPPNALGHCSA